MLREQVPVGRWAGLRVHMVGVGGCGMNGAACLLAEAGAVVSGSDMQPFEGVGRLTARGIRVAIGHRAEQVTPDVRLVVRSAAVPDGNPECQRARELGVPLIKYAKLLGLLMEDRAGVAIAGTHGKSTTTALATHLFRAGGVQASYVVGACADQLGGNGGLGADPYLIVEACEYDRSFLHLNPRYGAVLNVEPDHFDCYGSFAEIVDAFRAFASQVAPDGLLVCYAHDAWAVEVGRSAASRVATFGFGEHADWRAVNLVCTRGCYRFDVMHGGDYVLTTSLALPGRYNVANALAAIALANDAGANVEAVAAAVPEFHGVGRRLTMRGQGHGITVVDDYAHHPTEIRLTIEAVRSRYEPRRTWVVFQPHQYSRTRHLLEEFAGAFSQADEVIVPDVYGARETAEAMAGVGSAELVHRIAERGGHARHLPTLAAAAEHVATHVTEGDLVLTMGAGDVWKVADELVGRVCQ